VKVVNALASRLLIAVPSAVSRAIPTPTTAAPSEYYCNVPFDAATYPTCESKIAFAMDVRPDSWFAGRGLSTRMEA
jgi:hypothetical protein